MYNNTFADLGDIFGESHHSTYPNKCLNDAEFMLLEYSLIECCFLAPSCYAKRKSKQPCREASI